VGKVRIIGKKGLACKIISFIMSIMEVNDEFSKISGCHAFTLLDSCWALGLDIRSLDVLSISITNIHSLGMLDADSVPAFSDESRQRDWYTLRIVAEPVAIAYPYPLTKSSST
jgi:hypothetical protein